MKARASLIASIGALIVVLLIPGLARGASSVGFEVPGSIDQPLGELTPGQNGGIWYWQVVNGMSFPSGAQSIRIGQVAPDGTDITAPSVIQASAYGYSGERAAPAWDGGMWLLKDSNSVVHVAPDGSVNSVTLTGVHSALILTSDQNGNAWVYRCKWILVGVDQQYQCVATKIDSSLSQTTFEMASNSTDYDDASLAGRHRALAVSGGIWFSSGLSGATGSFSKVDFVAGDGAVSAVDLPDGATFAAPIDSDAIWITRLNGAWYEAAIVSRTNGLGSWRQVVPSNSGPASSEMLVFPGRGGKLLATISGEAGLMKDSYLAILDGPATRTRIVKFNETGVPPPTPWGADRWSPTWTVFGNQVVEVAGGGIWIGTLGAPSRISHLAPNDQLSTFHAFAGIGTGVDYRIDDLEMSNESHMWMSVNTSDGRHFLALADPLSPPEGFPKLPAPGSALPVPTMPPAAFVDDLADSIVASVAKSKKRHRRASSIPVSLPVAGRLSVAITSRGSTLRGRKLASGSLRSEAGNAKLKLRLTRYGKLHLFRSKKLKLEFRVTFEANGQRATSKKVRRM